MSRTVNVNPLLVLLSLLVGTSIGDWVGGFFGSFVAALLSIPVAGALQVIARELWQASAWTGPPGSEPPAGTGPRHLYLPFAIAWANDKRVMPSFPAARLSGGLVGKQQFAARQSRRQVMRTKESSPVNADGAGERDRALERTLRDALALAASKKVADRALRQARSKAHDAGRPDLRRVAAHLAGYGTLLTYIIWHQRRTQKQSAA
jgi:hypothetical protein